MVLFPNCKINLGLNVIRKRGDGFHDIETVFYPVKIFDALEIVSSENNFQYTHSGLPINNEERNNLCIKAFELLKKDFPQVASIKMHLHKTIPIGGGLGGGSSDAASTLKLLDQKFNLGLSTEKLLDYALQLGSDGPFFIINKPCYATGRGEFLEHIKLDLPVFKFVIVNPQIHISTAWAFSQIAPTLPVRSIKEIIQQPIETWQADLKNDFEEVVFKQHAEIKSIKEELYKAGAVYSSLSGSGSTVYGIFNREEKSQLNFSPSYFVRELFGQA
jgi:4-diphosphocytidyl-2-C-methyl-D-erythritol kinase